MVEVFQDTTLIEDFNTTEEFLYWVRGVLWAEKQGDILETIRTSYIDDAARLAETYLRRVHNLTVVSVYW